MALIELYGDQRSLAFVLNTADYECVYLLCAIGVIANMGATVKQSFVCS